MQLVVLNSFIMFDIVFLFFLFLIGVSCLVYYLPPTSSTSSLRSSTVDEDASLLSHHHHHQTSSSGNSALWPCCRTSHYHQSSYATQYRNVQHV
ncbi:hypothetical protein M8J76_016284 [Diaphorina citri]|nr:hypothetical protein M8J75_015812 [Diaphorina citri]KAI5750508.1 hypothetical protein M8J76_016284 [Diaphorina citri]KAI5753839.1 hypothetical protein M8J77_003720 [Diaphorina citri]